MYISLYAFAINEDGADKLSSAPCPLLEIFGSATHVYREIFLLSPPRFPACVVLQRPTQCQSQWQVKRCSA